MARKKKYFICSKFEQNGRTIDEDFFKSEKVKFLKVDSLYYGKLQFGNNNKTNKIYKNNNLSEAIEDLTTILDIDYFNITNIEDCYNNITKNVIILRYDKVNDIYSVVDRPTIINCINQLLVIYDEIFDEIDDSYFSELDLIIDKIESYYNLFEVKVLNKCFTKYKTAIIQMTDINQTLYIQINKKKDGYMIGENLYDETTFRYNLYNMSQDIMGMIIRVFTDQNIDNEPVSEIFGFIINNFEIENIKYTELKETFEVDAITNKKITAPNNLVYCDFDGNRLCSED